MLRYGCNGTGYQGWRTAEEYRYRECLPALLCFMIVKPAAFLDLPVNSRSLVIVHLNPVHAQIIVLSLNGILSIYQRQGHKRTSVFLPACHSGQIRKRTIRPAYLQNRRLSLGYRFHTYL
ncbi:hypothetical protein D3C72_429420 [compost metagenome]